MSRSYKNVRPKKDWVYTTEGLAGLYGVSPNTVSNWVKDGLRRSDNGVPYMFNGVEVKRFHEDRRAESNVKLRLGQFKCFSCKGRVFPDPQSLSQVCSINGKSGIWGSCPDCGGALSKRVTETDRDRIMNCVDTNTSLASLDEGNEQAPVGIGKDRYTDSQILNKVNDRILHEWLQFAGCWDQKTISAKLATIRLFEGFCGDKAFSKLAREDVVGFRDSLKASVERTNDKPLSISTVRHRASHLKSFLEWLIEQKGYQGLNKSLPGYLALPKKFDAAVLSEWERDVPSVSEAVQMLEGMPSRTRKERRDRAMVAIAFLAALRADTVTSLRIKHIARKARVVVQDAKSSRTKNGKSLRVKFFPLPDIFAQVVCDWKEELLGLGFYGEDALFPEERFLVKRGSSVQGGSVPVMASAHAISRAFEVASKPLEKQITPHAAKHCIGCLSLEVCKAPDEHKAWSINMGHESEEVTNQYKKNLRSYKNLSEERVVEIFEQFEQAGETESQIRADDKDLMLKYLLRVSEPGTEEYERGEDLVDEHRERRKAKKRKAIRKETGDDDGDDVIE